MTGVLRAADNDFTGPALTVTSHFNGQIVTSRTIVLTGTATDAGHGSHGISSVIAQSTIQGATAIGDATVNWSQSVTLNPGANNINLYAYDASASRNDTTVSLTINFQPLDSLPPNLTVISHANGAIVNTKTIVLSGTASDAGLGNNGISSVYVQGTVPGSQVAGAGTVNWSREITLNRGANYLYLSAADASDVLNQKQITLTINFQPVDVLPPLVAVTSHSSGQIVTTSTIIVSGTATDAGRGNNGVGSVNIQGKLPNVNASGSDIVHWSRSVDLRPGANSIYIYAYDQSDVANEALVTLVINFQPGDILAPILNITSHTNGQTVFNSNIVLAGTATDAGRGDHGISSIYLQGPLPNVSGTGAQVVNWSKSLLLSPGKNYLTVYAYDQNQFPNEVIQSLILNFQPADALGPNLAVTSHTDGQTVTTSRVTILGTASDAGRGNSGISEVYLQGRIDGATAVGSGLVNWSRTVDLTPGRNSISVFAKDNAPFPNETDQQLTLNFQPGDSLPPALQITSHTDGQVIFENFIVLRGTASDAGRGNNGVTGVRVNFVRADNDTATGSGVANWSRTFALNPGRNSIYVSALDGSPFPQETNVTLNVTYQIGDRDGPALTIDQPRNYVTVSTSSISVSGTVTDSGHGGSGVKAVTVNGVMATGGVASGSSSAAWSRTVLLTRGANVISVVGTDGSPDQNTTAQTLTVYYEPVDVDPPSLLITSHRNGQTVTTHSITLSGTASDIDHGSSGIVSVTVNGNRAKGDSATGGDTALWSRLVELNFGANVISVVARDGQQNDTALTMTITYDPDDTTPPDLVITSHRKGQIVSVPNILLTGTASDAATGANGIADVTVNAAPAQGGTAAGAARAQWSQSLQLKPGPNILSVVAHDNSPHRNAATESLTLVYEPDDLTPPEIIVTSHQNGQKVLGNTIILSGTATDFDRGDHGIASVTVNGLATTGGTVPGGGIAHWSRSIQLGLGENVISIVGSDGSPHQNSTAVTLTLLYDPRQTAVTADFCWAILGGTTRIAAGYSVAMDAGGNSYVTGSFEGMATLGGTNLQSRGLSDVLVAKYSPDGRLLWARSAGGTNADAGYGIAVDTAGACYVTGYFSGSAEFGPRTLKTTGSYDMFLAKYDTDGVLQWATNTGASVSAFGRAISVDAQGNSYLTGGFQYQAQFGTTTFPNNEFTDVFVAKYEPNGELGWALQLGGEADDLGTGIGVDGQGGCFVTGYFSGDAFFADEFLTSIGDVDLFVARFDGTGKLLWVNQAGAAGKTEATALSVDSHGNCLVTGYFDLIADFGTNSLFTSGFYDLFLTKYDANGMVLWARNTETSNAISAGGVATDGAGNAYLTGSFYGPAHFGPVTLTNGSTAQIFLAKVDADGNFGWVRQAGGPLDDIGYGVAADAGGDVVVTGTSVGLATFGSRVLSGGTGTDLVIARVGGSGNLEPIQLLIQRLATGEFQLQFQIDSCVAYRLQGSDDLLEWTTLATPEPIDSVVTYIESVPAVAAHRFFRVVSP